MADFCAPCTRGGLPGNDLAGWLSGAPGHAWALCEGCGSHLFDDAGERWCRDEIGVSPCGGMMPCPRCDSGALAPSFRFATAAGPGGPAEHPVVRDWLGDDDEERVRRVLPPGSVLVGTPLSMQVPDVNPAGLLPMAALLMDVARDRVRWCFNCATAVAAVGGPGWLRENWVPFVVLAGDDGALTVVCVACAAPF